MSTVMGRSAGGRRPESRIGAVAAGVDVLSKTRTTRFIGVTVAAVVGLIGSLAISATPAEAAVPGLIRVSTTSGSTPDDTKTMVVACPAGKQLVGTGARIDGATGKVVITSLWPNGSPTSAPTSLTAIAQETDPISHGWSLTVYGICANPLPGLVRISATSTDNSEDIKAVTALCPTGKRLVGTGFSIVHGKGQASIDSVKFLNLNVNPVPNHVHVRAHEIDVFYGNWTLYAFAVCATPPEGLRVYSATVFSEPYGNSGTTVVAPCPPGKGMLGAGFWTQADVPYPDVVVDTVLDDFTPNGGPTAAPTSVRVTHYEEDSPADFWRTDAYAICASLWDKA